jgi:predicted tellurium resistance membrane protein TerC
MEVFLNPDAWIILTFLEIVLGIDNIILFQVQRVNYQLKVAKKQLK